LSWNSESQSRRRQLLPPWEWTLVEGWWTLNSSPSGSTTRRSTIRLSSRAECAFAPTARSRLRSPVKWLPQGRRQSLYQGEIETSPKAVVLVPRVTVIVVESNPLSISVRGEVGPPGSRWLAVPTSSASQTPWPPQAGALPLRTRIGSTSTARGTPTHPGFLPRAAPRRWPMTIVSTASRRRGCRLIILWPRPRGLPLGTNRPPGALRLFLNGGHAVLL
jgi:hypothetical protein